MFDEFKAAVTEDPSSLGDQVVLRILIRAVLADGVVLDSEMRKVRELAATGVCQSDLVAAILLDEQSSPSDLSELAGRITGEETRASVYASCVAIMCSDGDVADSEREFLLCLSGYWAVPAERAAEMLERCLSLVAAQR